MKKQVLAFLAFMMISVAAVNAQGMQRQKPEERAKSTVEKLAPLALNADQATKTTTVFTDFYSSQQKAIQEMRESGGGNRETFMAKRKELADARDLKLKEIFTEEQYKKFKEEIEPTLMPQRRANQ